MNGAVVSRRAVLSVAVLLGASALGGCKIVSIAAEQKAAKAAAFDPKGWAEQLWAPKVVPYFNSSSKPLVEVVKAIGTGLDTAGKDFGYRPSSEGSPWSFAVAGSGTVLKKNTQSRAGTLTVALDGGDANQPVTVQIGPVIIGSAIRDALPFVNFQDFTNQIDFADAGKALTALALAGIAPVAATIKDGSKIRFTGALSMTSKSDPIKVTPVSLEVVS